MNLCFIDLETTGLEPPDAVILSIGAIADGEELYIVIKPTDEEWKRASPKALEVNGMTWDEVSQGIPLSDAMWKLKNFLVKHGITKGKGRFVGQNPSFDMKFLHYYMGSLLNYAGIQFEKPVDVRDVYRLLLDHGLVPALSGYSGKSIANALGVPEEPEPHNALEGARVVGRNYLALKKLWKNRPKDSDNKQ